MITCKNCFNRECEGRENMIVCEIDGESHEPDYTCENAEQMPEAEAKKVLQILFDAVNVLPVQKLETAIVGEALRIAIEKLEEVVS